MLRLAIGVGFAVALTMGTAPLEAQEAAPSNVVMRYFKCTDQGRAVALLNEGRPVIDQMVDEGKFLSYGILAHNWGDEWNVVDFFTFDGLDTFFANFGEMIGRLNAADDGDDSDGPSFGEVCTEHKDNIYAVVPPPSGN